MLATRKDRNRDAFFRRNFASLPAAIQNNFGNESVAQKRKLVNDLITRSENGNWTMNVQSPALSEWQDKYLEVTNVRGVITKPSGLAAPMGGWKELEEAVERNEVWKDRDLSGDDLNF